MLLASLLIFCGTYLIKLIILRNYLKSVDMDELVHILDTVALDTAALDTVGLDTEDVKINLLL